MLLYEACVSVGAYLLAWYWVSLGVIALRQEFSLKKSGVIDLEAADRFIGQLGRVEVFIPYFWLCVIGSQAHVAFVPAAGEVEVL